MVLWRLGLALAEGPVGAPTAEEAIQHEAMRILQVAPSDVEVRSVGLGEVKGCPGLRSYEAEAQPGEHFRGRSELWVTVLGDGRPCTRLRVSARVEVWMEAPVASRALAPGEAVVATIGRVRRQDVDGPVVDLAQGRWEVVAPIAAGQAITRLRARPAPLRRDGDPVEVVILQGGVRVKTSCEMLEDGYEGQRVRVLCAQVGSTVSGTLDGTGSVILGGAP
jgi:flagella basal body P-ring formation protein FlgA